MDEDEEEAEAEDDEYEDAEGEEKAEGVEMAQDEPIKTEGQIEQERRWGLYRDDSTSDVASQATKGDEKEEESDTEDEEVDWRRRDRVSRIISSKQMIDFGLMIQSDDEGSDPEDEDEGDGNRLIPLLDTTRGSAVSTEYCTRGVGYELILRWRTLPLVPELKHMMKIW